MAVSGQIVGANKPRGARPRNRTVGFRSSGRGVAERSHKLVDNALDEVAVVTLGHDANDRLGSRGSNDKTSAAAEAAGRVVDHPLDAAVVERLAAAGADTLEHLRQWLEAVTDLAHRPAKLAHDG
jgi:hypothetical protein